MATENFIPTVWSENLYRALDQQYIGAAHCNREFEGDIKNCGSIVRIRDIGNINVYKYTKENDLEAPQALSDTYCDLTIDQGRYFNFQVEDADRVQCTPKLMDAAMRNAAAVLAQEAERYIFKLYSKAGIELNTNTPTSETILPILLDARRLLYENNVVNNDDIVLEVTPSVASIILESKIATATDNAKALETGYLGTVAGCPVYVSNFVYKEDYNQMEVCHCIMRTKRAVAFAEQLSEIEAYRPEKRFADAVKGLHLYGATVVYPNEMVHLPLFAPKVDVVVKPN